MSKQDGDIFGRKNSHGYRVEVYLTDEELEGLRGMLDDKGLTADAYVNLFLCAAIEEDVEEQQESNEEVLNPVIH